MRFLPLAVLAAMANPAAAGAGVVTSGRVYVERAVQTGRGARYVVEPRERLSRGDRVIYVLAWRNVGARAARDVVVTNPLPPAIAFQSADGDRVRVSVDGGRSWGDLRRLRVRDADGTLRGARPEDVTHLRWHVADAVAGGAAGRLSFRGVVR